MPQTVSVSLGISKQKAEKLIRSCWDDTDNFDEFWGEMAACGFTLAQKNRKNKLAVPLCLVAVDEAGGLHTVSRRLGVSVKIIRERFSNIDSNRLPSIEKVLALKNETHNQ